jgi:hypothetical protein
VTLRSGTRSLLWLTNGETSSMPIHLDVKLPGLLPYLELPRIRLRRVEVDGYGNGECGKKARGRRQRTTKGSTAQHSTGNKFHLRDLHSPDPDHLPHALNIPIHIPSHPHPHPHPRTTTNHQPLTTRPLYSSPPTLE